MLKSNLTTDSYVGTSTAAKMLNISIGTVQNMVKQGELPAYLTPGGHRRIPYESILAYSNMCQAMLGKHTKTLLDVNDQVQIYVLRNAEEDSSQLNDIQPSDSIVVTSDPMGLLDADAENACVFIDGRLDWIDWMNISKVYAKFADCIVYNSDGLAAPIQTHLEKTIKLLKMDISSDFLQGYKLAILASRRLQS